MAAAQAAPELAADALCCLGLGFLLGALYDLARFLLGDRKSACFAADMGAFCLAAVLLCVFARHMAECVHRAHHEKKQKKAQARRTKQLQKNAKVLYNSK